MDLSLVILTVAIITAEQRNYQQILELIRGIVFKVLWHCMMQLMMVSS